MSRNCMCGIGSTYIYICNHSIPRALYLVCYCLVSSNALYGIATKYTYICNASIPRALYRVSSTCMNSVGTEYIYMKYLFIDPATRKRKPSHGQVPRFPEPVILDQLCVFLYPRCSMTRLSRISSIQHDELSRGTLFSNFAEICPSAEESSSQRKAEQAVQS